MATADDYQSHYQTDVAEHLRDVEGFLSARLLRRAEGTEVAFTSIAYFTDMDAIKAFAGDDPEHAVLEDAARRALSHWDDRVTHYEVAVDLTLQG